MTSKSFVLIANPHAGRGRSARIAQDTVTGLQAGGAAARTVLTTSIEHATELAAAAAISGDTSVAAGGDGLLRAVVNGAARHGGIVGIVPCGRGNDFARMVGITDVNTCVEVLLHSRPHRTDCIAVASDPAEDAGAYDMAIGNVYLGFDSLSNVLANKLKVNLGRFAYSYTAVRAALTMSAFSFRLIVDGRPSNYTGSGVVIANSSFYGRGVPVAPRADVHDGQLDVLMFQQLTRSTRIATLLAMRSGNHQRRADVLYLRANRIQVDTDPTIEAYSDGDPVATTPFTAWVLPGAVSLIRP